MEPFSKEEYNTQMVEQLREQVNNVMAAIQLLTPVIRDQGERRYDQYLAIANQSLYRMLRMMNHIVYVQSIEQGEKPAFRPVTMDIAGFCRTLSRQVEPLAAKAGVSFRYEESQGNILLQGDAELLRQLLLNLITNAIQWAGPGGQAGLRLSGTPDRVVLTVWDSGAGSVRPDQQGLGLGLPIARSIAALHGGSVIFEERPEQGGRAVVSLPVNQLPEEAFLRTPPPGYYDPMGGFSPILVELADALPYQAFAPDDME